MTFADLLMIVLAIALVFGMLQYKPNGNGEGK